MIKKIFVTGQCSLHWGRMEYGNIGNYYITEPLFQELYRAFPDAEIVTTMQLTEDFQKKENIKVVPMDLYYSWNENDLSDAKKELEIAKEYNKGGLLKEKTPYIEEVLKNDLIIDFSGDMWGKNADLAGENRFLIGLLKLHTAQLLNKKTVLFSCSPGPFEDKYLEFAKKVYERFDLVTLREPLSKRLLNDWGFNTSKSFNCACQSVLFNSANEFETKKIIDNLSIFHKNKSVIGFILCGWNMHKGPFNREYYDNSEFNNFVDLIECCSNDLDSEVCLISHSNGFALPPNFKLVHGRDYNLLQQVLKNLNTEKLKNSVYLLDEIYLPNQTKSIIGSLDMLISGRVHGAIAGLSLTVPTVIIDYGHEPKAHKLKGFAELYDVSDYIADPNDKMDLIKKTKKCFIARENLKNKLSKTLINVKKLAYKNIELIKDL